MHKLKSVKRILALLVLFSGLALGQTDPTEVGAKVEPSTPAWQTDEIQKLINEAKYCDTPADCGWVYLGECFSPCGDTLVNPSQNIYLIRRKIAWMEAGCPWVVACATALSNSTKVIQCQNHRCVWTWPDD